MTNDENILNLLLDMRNDISSLAPIKRKTRYDRGKLSMLSEVLSIIDDRIKEFETRTIVINEDYLDKEDELYQA